MWFSFENKQFLLNMLNYNVRKKHSILSLIVKEDREEDEDEKEDT